MRRLRMLAAVMLTGISLSGGDVFSRINQDLEPAELKTLPLAYINALAHPQLELSGFPWRKLTRLPEQMKNVIRPSLANCTAGGAVRFRTDSEYLAVRADLTVAAHDMPHMPRTGSSGFDIYVKTPEGWRFAGGAGPRVPHLLFGKFTALLVKKQAKMMREYLINFPLYNGVGSLEIGLAPGAKVERPEPYRIAKPILFYGSSITQGGCVSRPGNSYCAMLCRELDAPQFNLGFSGSAKGEPVMADLIAKTDPAAVVLEFDHNAPDAAYLLKTHEPFFRIIRKAHPGLPVVILSGGLSPERTAVIRATFERALAAGDTRVYFVDGAEYFRELPDPMTAMVDGIHPNDLGHYLMYRTILPVLRKALAEYADR